MDFLGAAAENRSTRDGIVQRSATVW
jgi:hypothetical protein